jgi:hypothetical protein
MKGLNTRLSQLEKAAGKRAICANRRMPLKVMVRCYHESWGDPTPGGEILIPWLANGGALMRDLRSRLDGADLDSIEGITAAWAAEHGAEWERPAPALLKPNPTPNPERPTHERRERTPR